MENAKSLLDTIMSEYAEFKDCCRKNRIYPDCSFLNRLADNADKLTVLIPADTVFFRARVFRDILTERLLSFIHEHTERVNKAKTLAELDGLRCELDSFWKDYSANSERGFYGFDEKDSFVNPDRLSVAEGRCNFKYETCLYVSESPQTAIGELRPLCNEKISVAKICNKRELKMFDFRFDGAHEENCLQNMAALAFLTSPTANQKDIYIISEVLCAFVKKLGYDGVIYSSSQNYIGVNYAVFNYTDCIPIGSEVYKVDSIKYTITNETQAHLVNRDT